MVFDTHPCKCGMSGLLVHAGTLTPAPKILFEIVNTTGLSTIYATRSSLKGLDVLNQAGGSSGIPEV